MTSVNVMTRNMRGGGSAVLLFLCLCFISACAHQPVRTPTVPPPAPVSHDSPARAAQQQLLQEAHRAFKERRYSIAALFYERFTKVAPDSPHRAEAHWWLGRSYESLGDFPAAMAQYRLVASGSLLQQANKARYEEQALRRLDDLYHLRIAQQSRSATKIAIRLSLEQLPPITQLSAWFKNVAKSRVVAVAVAPATTGREGLGPDLLREIVTEAHRHGILLWVVLDLHRGDGMEIKPEWKVTSVERERRADSSTAGVDVSHPEYQSYLEDMMRMLARVGCDGVLLTARSTPGFADEFSMASFQAFASSLEERIGPGELWGKESSSDVNGGDRSPLYWRWLGWKARNYGQLVTSLHQALRADHYTATLAVEVHQSSLTAPLEGLAEFGEDVVELATQPGWSVVVRREGAEGEAALQKLGRLAGVPDRIWAGLSVKTGTSPPAMRDVYLSVRGVNEYARWNLLVEVEPATAVP